MTNAVYAMLSRQNGLMREMDVVANNLANSGTTGFKASRPIFAEFLIPTGERSLSMGGLGGHRIDLGQGGLRFTGGPLDLAVQGEGYFTVQTPDGLRLTRAGRFQLSQDGSLVDAAGNLVLGARGNAIRIPNGVGPLSVAVDGSISAAGRSIDQIGVAVPEGQLTRDSASTFRPQGGFAYVQSPSIIQGALEQSNVEPVVEVARMIEVQRAYEAGQSLLEKEDERVGQLIAAVRDR